MTMRAFEEAHALLAQGGNWKQVDLGRENLAAVREYFSSHLCATNRECAKALAISVFAVGRHVRSIREEWLVPAPSLTVGAHVEHRYSELSGVVTHLSIDGLKATVQWDAGPTSAPLAIDADELDVIP